MANVKISALTDATAVAAADELPIVQGGVTKRATVGELKLAINDGSTTEETVSTTTYSVVSADFEGKTKVFTHASGCAVTIPVSVATTAGQVFQWRQAVGAGQITFAGDGTSTVDSADDSLTSGGELTMGAVVHLGSDDFLLVGQIGPNVRKLAAVPTADDTYEGDVISGRNAGATVAQWEAVYLGSGGTWLLADANGTGTYPARGLAVAAYVDTNAALVLFNGVARNDAWAWTVGGDIYLSGTPGALTQTAPSTSGDKVQKIGYALSADSMLVCIGSGEYLTVT